MVHDNLLFPRYWQDMSVFVVEALYIVKKGVTKKPPTWKIAHVLEVHERPREVNFIINTSRRNRFYARMMIAGQLFEAKGTRVSPMTIHNR